MLNIPSDSDFSTSDFYDLALSADSETMPPTAALGKNSGITSLLDSKRVLSPFDNLTNYDWLVNQANRYSLQKQSQEILLKLGAIRAPRLGPDGLYVTGSRYYSCRRYPIASKVGIFKGKTGRAYYSGLASCASVWSCPVCAPVIAGKRANEVRTAIYKQKKADGDILHLVKTFRHNRKMSLKESLKLFGLAREAFFRRGDVRRFLSSIGCIGRVSSVEITWSFDNGWHPHIHILLFVKRGIDMAGAEAFFSSAWCASLKKVGLSGLRDVACKLQDGKETADYLTKMALEMTMSNVKQGRSSDSYSPFQLLAESKENYSAALLWKEFFEATRGRHPLTWSKNLKEHFGISEKSDDEIAAEIPEPETNLFLSILTPTWKYAKPHMIKILAMITTGHYKDCFLFLQSLGCSVDFEAFEVLHRQAAGEPSRLSDSANQAAKTVSEVRYKKRLDLIKQERRSIERRRMYNYSLE
jgi:hypothetical protein